MGTCHLLDITTPGQVTLATFALEGTHDYIPPEILSHDREINRRAATTVDVYGFAITAWEVRLMLFRLRYLHAAQCMTSDPLRYTCIRRHETRPCVDTVYYEWHAP
jgi:hypothetical protein